MSFFKTNFYSIHLPPLLLITVCFIAGIILYNHVLLLSTLSTLTLGYILFIYLKRNRLQNQLLFCFFALTAGAYYHHKEWQDYHNFYTITDNKKVDVTGTILDIYQTVINHKKTTAIILAIDTIATENTVYKSNKLCIFYAQCNKSLQVGDVALFYDITCKKPTNEDFQRYQIKEQIVATVFDDAVAYKITHRPDWSIRYWLWNHKNRLLDSLRNKLSPDCFRFFTSLFLGNRSCIKDELEETNDQFKTWGISHFLARSGLHLVLFILMWQILFSVIPLPLGIKQIILMLISCAYFILTWTSAPFTRSFALFLFNKLCIFGKIHFHLLHYLTLTCLLFLLYCPLYIFFLDFQLSFALTFALAWLNQVTAHHKKTNLN